MIIHRPLMLSKSEAAIILAAASQCNVPISLRMKINKFIDNEFANVESFDIVPPTKRHVERLVHHQSRCVRVPIQTYADKKPRLKPIDIFDIKNGDSIISKDAEDGAIPVNGRVIYVSHDADQTLIQWVSFDKTSGGKYRYYGDERFTTKFYKVLDHGSC
ncbi:hypothetical protein ACM3P4_000573 [Escherichia coli]